MKFTAFEIESLLSQEEYKAVTRINKKELSKEDKKEVNEIEQIVSFGQDVISLFDVLLHKKGTLPSQQEFVDAGVALMVDWVKENKPQVEITDIKVEGIKLRLTRTYMSKLIELHLESIFAEKLPELTVKTFPLVDSVMGVDFIIEDDVKRYYTHVTSNTPFANKMLIQKESRGNYSRNFQGDLILKYDIYDESDTTQIINGFPLFKSSFIVDRFFIAKRQGKIGEPLETKYSKLQHFKDWAKANLNMTITSI